MKTYSTGQMFDNPRHQLALCFRGRNYLAYISADPHGYIMTKEGSRSLLKWDILFDDIDSVKSAIIDNISNAIIRGDEEQDVDYSIKILSQRGFNLAYIDTTGAGVMKKTGMICLRDVIDINEIKMAIEEKIK